MSGEHAGCGHDVGYCVEYYHRRPPGFFIQVPVTRDVQVTRAGDAIEVPVQVTRRSMNDDGIPNIFATHSAKLPAGTSRSILW
jgi:hypothetical protein